MFLEGQPHPSHGVGDPASVTEQLANKSTRRQPNLRHSNSPTNQLAEIDKWTSRLTDVSFRLLDIAASCWSFRRKPKATFRLAIFWRKQLVPVNLRQKFGAISSFICRSGAAISVSVCAMVIQMVICISRELSSKN